MILANIDYLNLLFFKLFIKKNYPSLYPKMMYHKSYPSKINSKFKKRQISGAFISSIKAQKQKNIIMGICANKEVRSVLSLKGDNKKDIESNTSNILAQILDINGEVVIGDKALKIYIENKKIFIDLAEAWYSKYKKPFVFAVFSINSHQKSYKKMQQKFLKQNTKIPFYIYENICKLHDISRKDLFEYLNIIYFKINQKEIKSLRLFWKLSKGYS